MKEIGSFWNNLWLSNKELYLRLKYVKLALQLLTQMLLVLLSFVCLPLLLRKQLTLVVYFTLGKESSKNRGGLSSPG